MRGASSITVTAGTGETPMLLDWVAHRAATMPDHPGLVASGRSWSYRTLDDAVSRVSATLYRQGVREGDRVAALLRNGAAPALLLHASLRLGAVLVPLNVRLGHAELAWQLEDAGVRLLVADATTHAAAEHARHGLDAIVLLVLDAEQLEEQGDTSADVPQRRMHSADATLAIIHTSGTTGRPKGAMLTVGNWWWSAVGSALNLGVHADDRWLACLPLFHVGGLAILVRCAIYGTTAVVHDDFDAARVNQAIDDDGITTVSVVAVMLERMLDERGDRPYPSSLRCVLLGGGPASLALLERCASLGVPVIQSYGLTETTSQVATLSPRDALSRPGSAGRALYPNELRIVRGDGSRADAGEPGEILVRGPVVTPGYVGRSEQAAGAIRDGWLHTGDVGYHDADGFLYVLDRRDDLIVTGGENVYPAEVEAALASHRSIAEAAVVGVADSTWGQRVVAVIRLTDGFTSSSLLEEALRAHCRERLAGYKTPGRFVIVSDSLLRTASGKLRRGAIRERLLG